MSNSVMPFDSEQLWSKAKVYIERAVLAKARHEDHLYPFWASLAIEFLGKSVLASYHPVLIVDPQDSDSLMGACGALDKLDDLDYRSIGMKTVVSRLKRIAPGLDKDLENHLRFLAKLRNTELHSGAIPFEGIQENSWAPEFWASVLLLLDIVGKDIEAFVGKDQAKEAKEMADARDKKIKDSVKKAKGEAENRWKIRSEDNGGEEVYRKALDTKTTSLPLDKFTSVHQCPVCQCLGLLTAAKRSLSTEYESGGTTIEVLSRHRTEIFQCPGCGLSLSGPQLVHGDLPLEVKIRDIAFDAEEMEEQIAEAHGGFAWEPDYGND